MINKSEAQVRRAIEDRTGYKVHDANVVLQANCPNIDLVVYSQSAPKYIQVKSSKKPAGKNSVVVNGTPFKREQLYDGAPIFNTKDSYKAHLIVIVHQENEYYIAPPNELEKMLRKNGCKLAERPKRDGSQRSLGFRGELRKEELAPYQDAWHLLNDKADDPLAVFGFRPYSDRMKVLRKLYASLGRPVPVAELAKVAKGSLNMALCAIRLRAEREKAPFMVERNGCGKTGTVTLRRR